MNFSFWRFQHKSDSSENLFEKVACGFCVGFQTRLYA